MSGLAGLFRGTRVPIFPGTFCVPLNRDRSLSDERDWEKISRDCPVWDKWDRDKKKRGTVPSRILPILGHGRFPGPEPRDPGDRVSDVDPYLSTLQQRLDQENFVALIF